MGTSSRAWLVGATLALVTTTPATAQTIRPLVSEYQGRARGRLELVNSSAQPLNVVVEPRGFTVDEEGAVADEPLPGQIHLKLSAMSIRIPAQQSRFIFYEATADREPAWFVLYANFTGYPRAQFNGLNIQLELPHFVYLLPKERWKAEDVRVGRVEVQREAHKVVIFVENRGQQFGRIDTVVVRGPQRKVSAQGFPLLPGNRKRLELDWDSNEAPAAVSLKSREFSFEQEISPENR